ncbi:T9SS type A sorting domain-containing protein [Seonamhaeicola sp. MEBiC1930]|uniref:T9SS type A sorting domain-containing protein n=1 Tax=Seonamhaeicola sp. MEBiC01930 TaxID=2976768 RepID=UPI0032501A05
MKKYYNLFKVSIVACFGLLVQLSQAQTTVNSLAELLPYLDDDNVNIKLAPGTYTIGFNEVVFGDFNGRNPLFLFEGSNSTYDFTGVTINFDTYIFQAFGNVDVNEIQILGNNNVLKNLTMEDIGTLTPTKGGQAILMDGRDNRIEGFHVTIRGSYPYGYGDAFGKGSNYVIKHYKHSGILIRGLRNHLKDCTVISRSYGHIVFMQAASYPTIEGCYIEGEMRSTDDMLAETSGPAYNVDFMTVWGYKLPAGYMMSLQEEGIRAYNGGTTYIDGVEIQRGTDNPTVINCTIKYARGGVTLAHATGTVRAENCTTIGCEQGYGLGSGTAINCKTDVAYGHAFKSTYDNDRWDLDVEIIPAVDPYYNGQKTIAFIGMDNSNLTLTGGDPNLPSDYRIQVGGTLNGVRFQNGSLANQSTHNGNNNSVDNQTSHPIEIASGSNGNTINTCGSVTNNGNSNSIQACTLSLENESLKDDIAIFPIPFHDVLNIKTTYNSGATVQIIDLSGKTVYSKKMEKGESQVNLGKLASGMYFAKITSDNQVFTNKIVKK